MKLLIVITFILIIAYSFFGKFVFNSYKNKGFSHNEAILILEKSLIQNNIKPDSGLYYIVDSKNQTITIVNKKEDKEKSDVTNWCDIYQE